VSNYPASLVGQRRRNKGTTNGRVAYGFGGLTSNKAQTALTGIRVEGTDSVQGFGTAPPAGGRTAELKYLVAHPDSDSYRLLQLINQYYGVTYVYPEIGNVDWLTLPLTLDRFWSAESARNTRPGAASACRSPPAAVQSYASHCRPPLRRLRSVAIALVSRGQRIYVCSHTVDRAAAVGESSRSAVYEVVRKIQRRCSECVQTFLVLLFQPYIECRQVIVELL
jgi:hypothetical protein